MAKTTKPKERDQDAELQKIGANAYAAILEMVTALDAVDEEGDPDETAREKAHEAILEDPLSLQVRSGWHSPGEDSTPEEFELLLGTGGPAVRIVGELDRGEPTSARLETQDWGTPWTEYRGAWGDGGREILLTYARQFFYGEG